ncbi:leucine-rich repeat extensin-like protein 5 [Strongylocentrotus purpuratus]|uniref:Uncharacterized protein n=1 Tax=Strongylocentrotus purpuratus TaxID=7668 RepID=A0A7M7HMX0_STRPU|nr:leucine-rich repeat extensin-like protein 5 [Strongylocentrotus purpuratus]
MAGPTATLQQGAPNPSQAGGTTSFVVKTSGMPSGWDAMGRQAYHTQLPENPVPVGNSTAQHHAHPTQNFPGTPYHPPPNGTLQYPQPPPTNPSAAPMAYPSPGATPHVNYPVMPPPPPTADTYLGMTSHVSEEHGVPPPPSYDDVFSSR